MKKLVIILAVLFAMPVVLTGCSTNYKTVSEYTEAMAKVKEANTGYVFEGRLHSVKNGVTQNEQNFKYQVANGKSKIEITKDANISQAATIYFDGKEIMTHNPGQKMLLVIFTEDMLRDMPEKERTFLFNTVTFGGLLYNWDSPTGLQAEDNHTSLYQAKFKGNAKMNGYQCRLVTFGEEESDFYSESCVNDKLGVAVYTKLKAESQGDLSEIVINADSIEVNTITEGDVEPPANLKRYTMAEFFKQMGSILSRLERKK